MLREEVRFSRGREKGQRCCLPRHAASQAQVARDKGQHLPWLWQPHGVKEREASLVTACQILSMHPPALAAGVRAALVAPWHEKDQIKEAALHLRDLSVLWTQTTRFIFFTIRQDSWTWAGRAGYVTWHPLPWPGLGAPRHCCPQGAFKAYEGKLRVHPAVVVADTKGTERRARIHQEAQIQAQTSSHLD